MRVTGARLPDISSNARIKQYPSSLVLQVANAPIFREAGWECKRLYDVPSKGNAKDPERSAASARARAKAAIRDIALCNRFTHFLTWTLSPEMVNRYDAAEVGKKVCNFLKNVSYRKDFSYLVIAERHKDGAIHFHGLCSLGSVQLERATNARTGKPLSTERGQPIFNMVDWKLGYSTCIPIDENYERTCNYLTKYITKDSEKIFGKWYFSSRNLVKHPRTELIACGMDYDAFIEDNPRLPIIPIYNDVKMVCLQQPLKEGETK